MSVQRVASNLLVVQARQLDEPLLLKVPNILRLFIKKMSHPVDTQKLSIALGHQPRRFARHALVENVLNKLLLIPILLSMLSLLF